LVIGLHYATKINHVILFWLAFIFTRPFGATFGDFLTKPIANGFRYFACINGLYELNVDINFHCQFSTSEEILIKFTNTKKA
jgi:uncharacterized membrane-anchored protein